MTGVASGTEASTASLVPERDRYVDLVRVVSMFAVVFLHWLSIMPTYVGGQVADRNVVVVQTWLWPLTWVGDVMALFFFVGGYANWVSLQGSLEAGESRTDYLIRRFNRLLRPAFVFFGVWLAIDLLFHLFDRADLSPLRHVSIGNTVPFGPLWFLGIYLCVIALSPLTMAWHRRWRWWAIVAMVACVAGADAVALALDKSWPLAGNLLLVWLIPHQLGYFYADGTLRRLPTRVGFGIAFAGLAVLAALTSLPYYSRILVQPRWIVFTLDAPMLSQVAAGAWLVGLAVGFRRVGERWLAGERPWRVVAQANSVTLPVYLWHMTAYLIAAAFLAWIGADFVYSARGDSGWWLGRIPLLMLSALVLWGLLWLLGRGTRLARAPVSPWHHGRDDKGGAAA